MKTNTEGNEVLNTELVVEIDNMVNTKFVIELSNKL